MTFSEEDKEKLLTLFRPGRHTRHPMPPLQYAVYNIWYTGIEPILALLDAGVELDAADKFGDTALHQAVDENEPEVYALLVRAGANQQVPDKSWSARTPAMAFEEKFGMTCEEKFRGMTIDAGYFRKKLENLLAGGDA